MMGVSFANLPQSPMESLRQALRLCAVIGFLAALSACGGGGGGGGSTPPPSPPPTGGNPPPPANQEPDAEAGEDQEIEWPDNTITVSGSATDPDPNTTFTYSWTATPAANVTFADANAASTTVTFAAPGEYELTLTVSDGTATDTDDLDVIVRPPVFPTADGWPTRTPAEAGMGEAKLVEARDYALTGGGAGVVVRKGRLVYSWGDIDQRFDVKSTTKSIGGIALGLALDDGRIDLSASARSYLPTLGNPPADNEATGQLDDITVKQLATHTAGFEKPQGEPLLVNAPGTVWQYSDGGLNWLADVLTQVEGQDLDALLRTRVWSVIGIGANDIRWRQNQSRPPQLNGIERRELASGIDITASAMARVGLLFLRNGNWNGQQILSQSFVDLVRTPPPENETLTIQDPVGFPNATTDYGLLWWTNKSGDLAGVPTDAYWAWGLGESLIVVIPSLDLVIARTGADPDVLENPRWRATWDGDYTVLQPFLEPIVQSTAQ